MPGPSSQLSPTLTMVGHAAVVLDFGETVLWTDPWLVSRAFNDSWEINPSPVLDPTLRSRITHIWISHEHPDHFNVPTLRSLVDEFSGRVEVLIQEHVAREPALFLRDLGFAVTELEPGRATALPGGVTVTCYPVGHEDSALMVRGGGHTVLNLNDCKPTPRELRQILRNHAPIDVLLDQFSGAGWNGNPGDRDRKQRQAQVVIDTLRLHVDSIDPAWLVPFASFVRFSHVENAHLMEERVTLEDVLERHEQHRIAVLAPGDSWNLGEHWDGTEAAVARYATADIDQEHALHTSEPVPSPLVIEAAITFVERLRQAYHQPLLRRVPAVQFVVADGDEAPACRLTIDLVDGVRVDDSEPPPTRVHLGSQAAHDAFARRWGMSTLLISGRFTIEGPEAPFLRLKQASAATAAGLATRGLLKRLRDPRFRALARRSVTRRLP